MYKIRDLETKLIVDMLLENNKIASVEYDGMELCYRRKGNDIKTSLMGIKELNKFLKIEEGNHFRRTIVTLEIPEGIDRIGCLFSKDGIHTDLNGRLLDRVKLPRSCVEIGDYAFFGCYNLEEVDWGGVEIIRHKGLMQTRISQDEIPFNIFTYERVCSYYDLARRPGRDGYVEYYQLGEWFEKSIQEIMDKRRKGFENK